MTELISTDSRIQEGKHPLQIVSDGYETGFVGKN
jgi:hypothetical protein